MNTNIFDPLYIVLGVLLFGLIIFVIILYLDQDAFEKNIHYYSFYDKSNNRIMYHKSNPFYRKLKDVYMSDKIKNEFSTTMNDFIKYSINFNKHNIPKSLRFILSGIDGIGKTTFIEAIASEFDYGLIHFPKNNYNEKMIHIFFKDINNYIKSKNIIMFDLIDFQSLYTYNKQLCVLLSELIIKNNKNNIFIFTFNDINSIPVTFSSEFHIHHHYHMDTNINYIMNMIKNNLTQLSDDEITSDYLNEIKNNLLKLNHKITPGYIIPYLAFNENYQKSLDRFFRVIKN